MPDTLVELLPVGLALMVPTELMTGVDTARDEEEEGVGVGEATTGYKDGRTFFTSDGRAWYHAGGLPAEREDAISAAKADEEARAYSTVSFGKAVARTMRTEF
jgi:hypothetical protein